MNGDSLHFLFQQLGYRMPSLLACGFGFVLALLYLRKCPRPAIITMLATGIMAATSLGTALVQTYMLWMMQPDRGIGGYENWMRIVWVMSAVIDAAALVLLVIAVFLGRRSADS